MAKKTAKIDSAPDASAIYIETSDDEFIEIPVNDVYAEDMDKL